MSSPYTFMCRVNQLTAFWDALMASTVGKSLCITSCIKNLNHLLACIIVYEAATCLFFYCKNYVYR